MVLWSFDVNYSKIRTLACVCLLQVTMGFVYEVVSPTLDEFKFITNGTDNDISWIYSSRSTGYVLGTLIGGSLFHYFIPLLTLICAIFVNSATIGLVGATRNLKLVYTIFAINGLSTGIMDVGTNVWILRLFSEKSGPYIMALYTSFSVGTIIAPLYTSPFIQDSLTNVDESRIHIPYMITSMSLMVPCVFLIYYFIQQWSVCNENKDFFARREKNDPKITGESADRQGLSKIEKTIVVIAIFMVMFYSGMEIIFGEYYIPMLNRSKLNLSSSLTAKIKSTMNAFHTLGKLIFVVITAILPPHKIILLDSAIITFSATMLIIFFNSSLNAVWIFSILFGFGTASLYPSIYPFIQTFMTVDYIKGSFLFCASSLTDIIAPIVIGNSLENIPNLILYLELVTMVFIITFTFAIKFLGAIILKRKSLENAENEPSQMEDISII